MYDLSSYLFSCQYPSNISYTDLTWVSSHTLCTMPSDVGEESTRYRPRSPHCLKLEAAIPSLDLLLPLRLIADHQILRKYLTESTGGHETWETIEACCSAEPAIVWRNGYIWPASYLLSVRSGACARPIFCQVSPSKRVTTSQVSSSYGRC